MTRDEFIRALALEFAKQGKLFTDIANDTRVVVQLTDRMINKTNFSADDFMEALSDISKMKRWKLSSQRDEESQKNDDMLRRTFDPDKVLNEDIPEVPFMLDSRDEDGEKKSDREEPYTEEELREIEEAVEKTECGKDKKKPEPELNELGYRKDYDDVTEDDIPGDYDEFCEKTKRARTFEMTPVEYLRWQKFQEEHRQCMRRPDGLPRFGAIGGGMSVTFSPTGLGNLVAVRCGNCDTRVDITDTTHW